MTHPKSTPPPARGPLRGRPPRAPAPIVPLLARTGVRRAIAGLAVALIAFGAGMLVYPLATNIYTSRAQGRLRRDFATQLSQAQAADSAQRAPGQAPTSSAATPSPDGSADNPVVPAGPPPASPLTTGQGIALIQIPRLRLDTVVVEGTDPGVLRNGPGHYPGSPHPCAPGNVAIAGHRTTYGRPFAGLDLLRAGDEITLVTPQERCTYQVVGGASPKPAPHKGAAAWITSPGDWSAVGPLKGSYLTLTTCHPKGSASQRLIVRARLVSAVAAARG